MGKGNVKKELTDILNNRNFLNAVSIALVLAFVLLAISFLATGRKKTVKTASTETNQQSKTEVALTSEEISSYESLQKRDLKNLISKMDGVGEVEVMMYFKSGEIKVPALDNNTQVTVTEESDRDGGKRVNNQQSEGTKVVMSGNGSDNEPVILKTYKPEITGIVIVAEGAEKSKVKYDIQTATSSLYGISLDKVNVYPMKN
ncbi:stage III sporulation protein AG [Clostridium carnis]